MGDITSNLLVWLELDEGSGTRVADQSGNWAHGACLNSTWTNDGTRGQSATFNGTTGNIVAPLPDFTSDGMTFAAWCYLDSGKSYDYNPIIQIAWYGDTGTWSSPYVMFALQLWSSTGEPYFSATYSTSKQATVTGAAALGKGAWHHLVGVVTNTSGSIQCKLYKDGTLYATGTAVTGAGTFAKSNSATVGDIVIGGRADVCSSGTTEQWGGMIQGVRIYTRALADADITDLYNFTRGSIGTLPTLVHKYPLNEGTGVTATDSQGLTNGSIANGTWYNDATFGNVLQFDGSSTQVEIANSKYLNSLISHFSLSAWVNLASDIGNSAEKYIFCRPLSTSSWSSPYADYLNKVSSSDTYDTSAQVSSIEGNAVRSCGVQSQVSTNSWHHIVYTFSPANGQHLYVDGVSVASAAKSGTYPVIYRSGTSLFIGATGSSGASAFFKGLMRNVEVYHNELTAGQVSALYDAEGPSRYDRVTQLTTEVSSDVGPADQVSQFLIEVLSDDAEVTTHELVTQFTTEISSDIGSADQVSQFLIEVLYPDPIPIYLYLDSCQRCAIGDLGYAYTITGSAAVSLKYRRARQSQSYQLAQNAVLKKPVINEAATAFIGAAVRLGSFAVTDKPLLQLFDGNEEVVGLYLTSTATLKIKTGNFTYTTSTESISATTRFVYLELGILMDNSTGYVRAWANGRLMCEAVNQDTERTTNNAIDSAHWCGAAPTYTYMTSLYCLAYNDENTDATPLGNIEIQPYLPVSDNSNVGWQPNTGVNLFASVDEPKPLTGDYIFADDYGEKYTLKQSEFTYPDPNGDNRILGIQAAYLANATDTSMYLRSVVQSAELEGYGYPLLIEAGNNWAYHEIGFLTNPIGGDWDDSELAVNALMWGGMS